MKAKICGITNTQDTQLVTRAGVDAIGLIFTSVSPRCISLVQAQDIVRECSPFVSITGVFQDQSVSEVINIIKQVGIQVIQLHGQEDIEYIRELRTQTQLPIIKAYRQPGKPELDILQELAQEKLIQGILIDKESQEYNYSSIYQLMGDMPIILAGGINSSNAGDIIKNNTFAYAIDLCSGVEDSPGQKSQEKVQELFEVINNTKSE